MGQAKLEAAWLPKLAPHLPLAVPLPLATGKPTDEYPWTLVRLSLAAQASSTTPDQIADSRQAAADLAGFVTPCRPWARPAPRSITACLWPVGMLRCGPLSRRWIPCRV
ncbi:MAG: hypothetical protein R2838_06600 [Caldilineaceae bacterium]